jgi:hypothetical protein
MRDRERAKWTMKPIAAISLFRWINSLFERKKFRVPNRAGNPPQYFELRSELAEALPKRRRKWPKFEKFAVIFPVGREFDRGRSCLRFRGP